MPRADHGGTVSPLRSEVAATFYQVNAPLEAVVPALYLDIRGIPTTAVGCVVLSADAMCALPWRDASGALASDVAKRAEHARVCAMKPGQEWHHYAADGRSLHLQAADIAALVMSRLAADVELLVKRWPAFANWPAGAQMAACLIVWAVGAGSTRTGIAGPMWPHLQAALDAEDWDAAGREGKLSSGGNPPNPGVIPRNKLIAAAFASAATEAAATMASAVAGDGDAAESTQPQSPS